MALRPAAHSGRRGERVMSMADTGREQAMEYAEIFVSLGDLKRAGRYNEGADLLGDVLDAEPTFPGDTKGYRMGYLITIGAWVIAETIRASLPVAVDTWGLMPVEETADQQTPPAEMAALRAVTAMLNDDRPAAADVIKAHVAVHGANSLLDLLSSLLCIYQVTMDEGLSC
jgi:hypothetical protein